MSEEKRQFHRVGLKVPMKYLLIGEFREIWRPATILDLGAGGLRFESEHCFESGSRVGGLRFESEHCFESGSRVMFSTTLPLRPEPYEFVGEVLWERRVGGVYEYGVVFVEVTVDQQSEIDQLVQFLRQTPGSKK